MPPFLFPISSLIPRNPKTHADTYIFGSLMRIKSVLCGLLIPIPPTSSAQIGRNHGSIEMSDAKDGQNGGGGGSNGLWFRRK
jgi:hypothetical protein